MDSAGLFIYTLLYCQFICTDEIFYLFYPMYGCNKMRGYLFKMVQGLYV